MTFSLYDATIPSTLQILRALDALLDKAETFAVERGMAPAELIEARLADDMLPLGYQVKACAVHSIGAVESVGAGSFSPDRTPWPTDFAGLHTLIRDAIARLEAIDPGAVDALAEARTTFAFGQTVMPYTGANFLLSFSQPNFYFHATTAYAILRSRGLAIGKRDFMGIPRFDR
ncbi:DUF1993 domain-containing protein [Sphingomonas sp.]|jgi:hypothetical protein|uniref:DUF1993 domain-containing protein n=1 Tax=Sphingomonas sp. TaxID=28214 RepID=UPI002ED8CAF7